MVGPAKSILRHGAVSANGQDASSSLQVDSFNFDKYDKRVSRDDFYVSLKPEGRLRPRQIFPAPGTATTGLPTPEASPNSIATSRAQIPVIRLPTPESASDSSSIGMAIGSPVRQQTASSSNSQQTLRPTFNRNPTSPLSAVESVGSTGSSGSKKQAGKWKLFGRFGKKHTETAQSSPPTSAASTEMRGASRLELAFSAPRMEGDRNVARNNTVAGPKTPAVEAQQRKHQHFQERGQWGTPGSGFLDVEIPDSNMERYSVMFGDVLKNNHSASSLLARRQATLNKLKTINDVKEHPEVLEDPHKMNRRATSPQPMASPSFNLFPQPSSAETAARQQASRTPPKAKGSSLARSNTSPAIPPKSQMNRGKMTIATLARSREQSVPRFNADESSLILESPTEMDEEGFSSTEKEAASSPPPPIIRSTSVKPKLHEPKWQMMSSPSQQLPMSGASSITSSRKRSPSSISSAQTHITKPSVDSETLRDLTPTTSNTTSTTRSSEERQHQQQMASPAGSAGMSAVELSIARQISVSREQRRMLKPLQTTFGSGPRPPHRRGSGPGSSGGAGGKLPLHISPLPTPKIAMGQNERLAETKLLTPTLVTPQETEETKLLEHRKSERIVLEG
ncbi:hypothetical protein PG997_008460 [Apiospora hydei]|uniref:Uncharacterized protein n=1 Tax=Apiospora hydei TaxID=1337664 RepID=A0ABR1WAY2_9PEZI